MRLVALFPVLALLFAVKVLLERGREDLAFFLFIGIVVFTVAMAIILRINDLIRRHRFKKEVY